MHVMGDNQNSNIQSDPRLAARHYAFKKAEKSLRRRRDLVGEQDMWAAHRALNEFNLNRLQPRTPTEDWIEQIDTDARFLKLEGRILDWEISQIKKLADAHPEDPKEFMMWFEALREIGPGQNHALFDYLAEEATLEQMKWFITQEIAGEAGFDDLTAMTQIKISERAKLEIARNYWDEMGRGRADGMHGPMLSKLATELALPTTNPDGIVAESLALGNILLGFAANRRHAYHSVGALGVVELTAPERAKKVYLGLKRLGVSSVGQRYYLLHSSLDVQHSLTWNKEVILPLISEKPEVKKCIAEGAMTRLQAGRRCFDRYALEFGLKLKDR